MSITRLIGGLTPADGADPRTFPAIWNATATDLESALDGGSAGQVLVKSSGTDFDAAWGTLYPALEFQNAPMPQSYLRYPAPSPSTSALTLNVLYLTPVYAVGNFDRLACEVVTTPASAGGVARLGLYNAGLDGRPTTLVVDAGTVDITTTGIKEAVVSLSLNSIYYVGVVMQVAAATMRSSGLTTGLRFPITSAVSAVAGNGFTQASVSGALPSSFSGSASPAGNVIVGGLRRV